MLDSKENKQKILKNFLEICAFEGWNKDTLSKSFKMSGIDEKFIFLLFENDCLDLIDFYIDEINSEVENEITNKSDFPNLKVREKIKFALYFLFESQKHNQLALQRLKNFYLDIKNFASLENGPKPFLIMFKHVGKISDNIWFAIGDKSTDFNFYTKRLTLAKIIIKSFSVFLNDNSSDLSKTKEFIDLQIEKVMNFEKFKSKIKKITFDIKTKSCSFFCDENKNIKTPKQFLKDLPFIRLFN